MWSASSFTSTDFQNFPPGASEPCMYAGKAADWGIEDYLINLRRNLHIETASILNRLTFVVLLVHKSYIICVGEIIPVIEFFSPAVSGPESLIIESDWLIARALAVQAPPSGPRLKDCLAQELLKRFLFEHKVTLMKGL